MPNFLSRLMEKGYYFGHFFPCRKYLPASSRDITTLSKNDNNNKCSLNKLGNWVFSFSNDSLKTDCLIVVPYFI